MSYLVTRLLYDCNRLEPLPFIYSCGHRQCHTSHISISGLVFLKVLCSSALLKAPGLLSCLICWTIWLQIHSICCVHATSNWYSRLHRRRGNSAQGLLISFRSEQGQFGLSSNGRGVKRQHESETENVAEISFSLRMFAAQHCEVVYVVPSITSNFFLLERLHLQARPTCLPISDSKWIV